jgi:general secretion pathway protein G
MHRRTEFLFPDARNGESFVLKPGDIQMRIARVCTSPMEGTQLTLFLTNRKLLVALVLAAAIMVILVGAAFPQAKSSAQIEREHELRHDLSTIRDAIHRYKAAADRGAIQVRVGSQGYPTNLDALVTGTETDSGTKLKFLDRIPVDPITKQKWGLRFTKKTIPSEGQGVLNVYCKSDQVASDGTKYKDW